MILIENLEVITRNRWNVCFKKYFFLNEVIDVDLASHEAAEQVLLWMLGAAELFDFLPRSEKMEVFKRYERTQVFDSIQLNQIVVKAEERSQQIKTGEQVLFPFFLGQIHHDCLWITVD